MVGKALEHSVAGAPEMFLMRRFIMYKYLPLPMMKRRTTITFYLFIAALTVLDAVLIRSPNLLGKIGLIVYKYYYLRTFPKALLTVSIIIGLCCIISETIRYLIAKSYLKAMTGSVLLLLLTVCAVVLLVKTGLDFSAGSYSRTGLRFRMGAYLLPAIMTTVFAYNGISVVKDVNRYKDQTPVQPDQSPNHPITNPPNSNSYTSRP
jgi:hypothetical protein